MIFLIVSIIGVALFWLFYSQANTAYSQAKHHSIESLRDPNLSEQDKNSTEKQLSKIIQNKPKTSLLMVISFAIILIPLSYYFYYSIGTPNITELISLQPKQQTNQQAPQMSMEEAISKLETRLNENPNDIDAQMLYARSQVSLTNYEKAVTAYRKANDLAPNEAVILTELAEAIALFNDNRSFLGEPESLLSQAVQIDPNNQKALWLYGMTFYEKGDLTKTNEIWSQLYLIMSDESAKAQLLEQLSEVRAKLGIASEIATDETNTAESNKMDINALVNITINISSQLLNQLDNKPAVLYVYTKATTGMTMPIAVARLSLEQITKSFPINIAINDSNSLQSSRLLSSFETVTLGARISFSGNATPQAGDFESKEIEIEIPSTNRVELIIDSIK
jgi:cytochrome c-type biogenesis protein CcmH